MAISNNYPEEFAKNILPVIFITAARDYFDPAYNDEVVRFLQSEEAELISGGVSKEILKMCELGIKPTCNKKAPIRKKVKHD